MASERISGGIYTEQQLLAAIEADQWCDSDGESSSENDETDYGLGIRDTCAHEGQYEKTDWHRLLWNTEDYLDDDTSFISPNPPQNVINVESILRQLFLETDSVDFEDQSSTNNTESDSQRDIDTNGSSHGESEGKSYSGTVDVFSSQSKSPPIRDEPPVSAGKNVRETEEVTLDKDTAPLEPEISPTVDESNTDTAAQLDRPKHYYIAHEIMTTERTYVQNLRLLEKVVHGAIKTANLTKRTILPEQGRKEIFLNIGEIYALNFDLLQELEERIENWDSNPMIADVLAKRAPFFKLYSMYSARFDSAQVAYCKWLRTCKPFANLIRMIETGPLCKGLPVSSYMLCPVQRVPRYKLLLQDYLKHLPEGHPDIQNTKAALAAISEAADYMNERISDLENQAKVVQMQKTFVGKENIVAPGRRYVGRGPVYFVPGSRRKQRVLFLFSDILLIAGITAHGRYRVHKKMALKNLLVSVVQSPVLNNAFCIAERGLPKPLRFCTESLDERNKWITELNKAKIKEDGAFVTLSKNSPYASVLNDPEAHSSILDVLNDPSFEHNQPSWVRRSLRLSNTVRKGLPFTSYALAAAHSASSGAGEGGGAGGGTEEVDFSEEVVTEFVSGGEREERVLKPGLDNSLSSYMNQLSVGGVWRRRWFVLTCRTLICYQDHNHDEASGALSLTGYSVAVLQSEDGVALSNTFKLSHHRLRSYNFQLPNSYDFDRWFGTLQELLQHV